jgi:Polyketide cyclase / dehydrase and lipid transport
MNRKHIFCEIQTYTNDLHDTLPWLQLTFEIPLRREGGVHTIGAGESVIEEGKSGDTVGAIRNVLYRERQIRQRLLALSDVERSQTYEFCGAPSLPVVNFRATLRIREVADGDRAFVEWWATFDCELERRGDISATLRGWFATWLESLRRSLPPPAPALAAAS